MTNTEERSSIGSHVRAALTRSAAPGALIVVADDDGEWMEAIGAADLDGTPWPEDPVLRISSLTKPVIAVLTLLLEQDGVLALTDPASRWLPELAELRVLPRPDDPLDEAIPAIGPLTVEHLLTMRLGTGFAFETGDTPLTRKLHAAGLGLGPPLPTMIEHHPDAWIAALAELPLLEEPGTAWRYDLAYAVLGVLLARAAGVSLPDLLRQRLTGPLGMDDTGFTLAEHQRDRLVPCFAAYDSGAASVFDGATESAWARPPAFPSASGGLLSTPGDLLRFTRMLASQGVVDGRSFLDSRAVARMTSPQVPPRQLAGGGNAAMFLLPDSWGYGVGVRTASRQAAARYGWAGGLGTYWYTYPEHRTVAMCLTQCMPPPTSVMDAFYSALEEHLAGGAD